MWSAESRWKVHGCSLHNFLVYWKFFMAKRWGELHLPVLHGHRSRFWFVSVFFCKLPTYIIMQMTAKVSFSSTIGTHLSEVPGIHFLPPPSVQRSPERNCVFTSSYDARLLEPSDSPPQGTHVHGAGPWRVLTQKGNNGSVRGGFGVCFMERIHMQRDGLQD